MAVFHSRSAFCNAGFDLMGENGAYQSLIRYSDDWLVNKKILTTIYETAEKTGVDYVEMGMQRVMDRYGVVKKRDSVLLTD